MLDFLTRLKEKTRWDSIPQSDTGFRLLCSDPSCSLSCANLKNGRFSVTATHGTERHSYTLSKNEMVFISLLFLDSLEDEDMEKFCKLFSKLSAEGILTYEKI